MHHAFEPVVPPIMSLYHHIVSEIDRTHHVLMSVEVHSTLLAKSKFAVVNRSGLMFVPECASITIPFRLHQSVRI